MDVERLLKCGEKLGLHGEDLRVWVDEKIEREREEKEKERLDKEKEREEKEKERLDKEKEREEKEKERLDKEKERAEKEKERDATAENLRQQNLLMDRQLELERLKLESSALPVSPTTYTERAPTNGSVGVKSPRLPCFDESKDQIDSYLLRFERYATVNKWNKADWAIHLSALLRGNSLDVYTRLDEDDATNYEEVKKALLKRYNLTEDGFQERFRKSRPEAGERMGQFKTRICTYLEKWMSLSGKDKTKPEDIIDLVVKEQITNVCGRELVVFLKERKPKTADDVVDLVEKYVEAHGTVGAFSRSGAGPHTTEKSPGKNSANAVPFIKQPDNRPRCHLCFKVGHLKKDCRVKAQTSAMFADVKCDYCHRRNHKTEDCWERKRRQNTNDRSQAVAAMNIPSSAGSTQQVSAICSDTRMQHCNSHSSFALECGCQLPVMSAACSGHVQGTSGMPVAKGLLNGKPVTVLRDSGSSCVVVRRGLIEGRRNGESKKALVYLADGRAVGAPLVEARIDCPYFVGQVTALEMESPLYDVILGNITGVKCPGTLIQDENVPVNTIQRHDVMTDENVAHAVQTRGQREKRTKNFIAAPSVETGVSVEELKEKQSKDETLAGAREAAISGDVKRTGTNNSSWYAYDKGVLVRYFQSPKVEHGDVIRQVMVPKDLRETVMRLAHESIFSGHLAARKTTERILTNFYWVNIWDDVMRFCRSCDQCQRSTPKGKTAKVPLSEVPLIDESFSRVAVDLVGPMVPASERGNRYILTVVDYCTRYPEAVVLKNIETKTVAEGLVDIFSRTGIPKEILSDRGTQFTSDLMKEVCKLLSMKQLSTSPYHPQCNGLVERFNGTLKGMLKRLATERPSDWDRYLNAALFAYREAPQESLGFSPFELLYGRPVRGPMTILRELWTESINDDEVKTTYQYVVDLKEKLEKTIEIAHTNLQKSSSRYKAHFDKKAKMRTFKEGDKVLLLLPTKNNKLELKWQGPFVITRVVGTTNYVIEVGTTKRTYHANLLKRYYDRNTTDTTETGVFQCAVASVIEDEDEDGEEAMKAFKSIEMPSLQQKEFVDHVVVCEELGIEKRGQLEEVLSEFKDVLTDVPGCTDKYVYDLKVSSDWPIRKKPYPVPQAMRKTLKAEVEEMIKAGIVEPSTSPYCSPSVVVKKKDGTNRYCVDFRALNNISVFDAEPMPRLDDLFQEIGTACNYVSKIDLTKGYWQIPLSDQTKEKTAFATELGLMQFKVLPFGLQCAPAAFSRMMRKVVGDLPHVKNYIDDILIHTDTWQEHLLAIQSVFERLRDAKLTAKPSKCLFGFGEVEFLGHRVGSGRLLPTMDKVEAIKNAKPPVSKKQMRSFLGLAGFYRRYVPNFSAIVSPLSDATRKGMPNRIQWGEPQDRAFNYIKNVLTQAPVLRLPDFQKPFILATDASDTGIGAVLMQEYDDGKYPVVYLSRKLLPREQRYSVVEKECLALVWAVKSLNSYLMGREFIVETDHAPLLYLNKAKSENGRVMRWSLLLHQYRFRLKSVKGSDNHGPDFLSRLS